MLLAWLLSTALAQDCTTVHARDLLDVPAPAVLVLGERHGMRKDLGRATKIARALAAKDDVRVALEAVDRRFDAALGAYAHGVLDADDLERKLDFPATWGFPYRVYAPLVRASAFGAEVVGVGLKLGPKPDDVSLPVPPRYIDLLRPAMGDHEIPLGMEQDFVQAMAWRDYGLASKALQGWDGKGYLVLVVGRGHVEGGKGVAWQASRLTDVPVHSFVLAATPDMPCYAGDQVWR
ncbi:MAG: ChaN family lipoprotein [Alphaproteobacteria bacterium]|nr:ChaN family lipoprotein [Alphaproteobacteria bacterium]